MKPRPLSKTDRSITDFDLYFIPNFKLNHSNLEKMALRATGYWRSMASRLGGNRPIATSTPPKMKQVSSTFDTAEGGSSKLKGAIKAEYAPVYVVMGMVLVALGMAVHTAKQQLMHSPSVTFSKKKRENMAEVYDPDSAYKSADKFVTKSFLRKVAHIQDNEMTVPDPMRGDAFSSHRRTETLKSVGVESGGC